jgi:hypothetical protein
MGHRYMFAMGCPVLAPYMRGKRCFTHDQPLCGIGVAVILQTVPVKVIQVALGYPVIQLHENKLLLKSGSHKRIFIRNTCYHPDAHNGDDKDKQIFAEQQE